MTCINNISEDEFPHKLYFVDQIFRISVFFLCFFQFFFYNFVSFSTLKAQLKTSESSAMPSDVFRGYKSVIQPEASCFIDALRNSLVRGKHCLSILHDFCGYSYSG